MNLLHIFLASAAVLIVAYLVYGRLLSRLLELDPQATTPAELYRDDADYVPIERKFLLGQHFSAIAAAGPIVGPILAGLAFGWAPALIWIVLGSIFIGGVHDMTSLVASVRHKARSIAEVVRDHMTRRSYVLFLAFIWIALVYIIVAFTDVTASSFVGLVDLTTGEGAVSATAGENAAAAGDAGETKLTIRGSEIASSSLMYLLLPVAMGLLMRYTGLSLTWATVIFLPLVAVTIWAGQYAPFDLAGLLGVTDVRAQKVWGVALLLYCLVAGVAPMWLLLQPRGHLGGFFLYAALLAGMLGVLLGGSDVTKINYPAFRGWDAGTAGTLVPFLFITIACGACSGFHSLIASGTTSKQLKRETDARLIGYGTMLMEAMVAVLSLSCVMILTAGAPVLQGGAPKPNFIYANGIGRFLEVFHIPTRFAVTFALMAFTTFVYDTLDVCTRLGRYILQELTGWRTRAGAIFATALTAGVPLVFLLPETETPVWRTFWALFGASNQLLAALTLLGVTVWLWRTRRAMWVWAVTGLPTVLMYTMSVWALLAMIGQHLSKAGLPLNPLGWGAVVQAQGLSTVLGALGPVPWVAIVLIGLAALMLVEAVRVFARPAAPPSPPARPNVVPAPA